MGSTIHGWVEYSHVADGQFEGADWHALVNVRELLGGEPPFGGYLFGAADTLFDPIAPDRGLPDKPSRIASLEHESVASTDESWISLAELEATNWGAVPELTAVTTAQEWDRAVYRTEKRTEGGEVLEEAIDAWDQLPEETLSELQVEKIARHDGDVYQVIPRQLRDLATYDWAMLWSWLRRVRDRWGLDGEHIRLVVWFAPD